MERATDRAPQHGAHRAPERAADPPTDQDAGPMTDGVVERASDRAARTTSTADRATARASRTTAMAERTAAMAPKRRRAPLTRDKVLRAALRLADEHGIEAVSMRRLGQALRVEAMSLYKHVTDKDDLLDGLADLVTLEFVVPAPSEDWRASIRASAISVHAALRRHPWAGPVLESRIAPGPTRLAYLDGVLATLAAAGFTPAQSGKAFMALDSHTYGFAMQELSWAYDPADSQRLAAEMADRLPAGRYPSLQAMARAAAMGGSGIEIDFTFGLDLLLDGLERLRTEGTA
jgi:AcrR family transcriptional regulator